MDILVPPLNFSIVQARIYRSGHPNKKNMPFLKKLQLKTIVYLCADDYAEDNVNFAKENGISIHHVRIEGNKVVL